MIKNKFGQQIYNEADICDLLMQGREAQSITRMLVDNTVNIEQAVKFIDRVPDLIPYAQDPEITLDMFDQSQQANWHMPQEYRDLDIAEYVLSLCTTEAELQRVGEELLLYQERDLFNLLRYLKYLVDVMTENKVIWGVGRGSSVASYILYKLKVHRINSMFYKLKITEFLR